MPRAKHPQEPRTCAVCHAVFTPPPGSKRTTCGRSCQVALAWKDPEKAARRIASLKADRAKPERQAVLARLNDKRWARPGEREKLSELNRQRWASGEFNGARIAAAWTPERRAASSEMRRRQWAQDEAYRRKTTEGIRRALQSPEYRARFSALLKARWQDPAWRAKYLAGILPRLMSPEMRVLAAAAATRRWEAFRKARSGLSAALEEVKIGVPTLKPSLAPPRAPLVVRTPSRGTELHPRVIAFLRARGGAATRGDLEDLAFEIRSPYDRLFTVIEGMKAAGLVRMAGAARDFRVELAG